MDPADDPGSLTAIRGNFVAEAMTQRLPPPAAGMREAIELDCGEWGRHRVRFQTQRSPRRGGHWFWVAVHGEQL